MISGTALGGYAWGVLRVPGPQNRDFEFPFESGAVNFLAFLQKRGDSEMAEIPK